MKKRLEKVARVISMVIMGLIGMMTFPVWIVIWVITGFDLIDRLSRFADPEFWAEIDEMNRSTAKIKAKAEKNKKWLKEMRER